MSRQELGFCTAPDGVRLAYATIGEGPPLVYVCGWPVHLALEWEDPEIRAFLHELGAGHTLIRYDMRGSGLSDHDASDFSLGTLVSDLDCVIQHLALDRLALLALGDMAGPTAIEWAATHVDRVTHLILHSAFARGDEITSPDRQAVMVEFIERFGFPIFEIVDSLDIEPEALRKARKINRSSTTTGMQAALMRTMYGVDVSGVLDRLTMPTLVLHATDDPLIPFALGRELSIRLPHARFVPFEGTLALPWAPARKLLLDELHRFLGVSDSARDESPASTQNQSTDVALTPREREVLALLAKGASSRSIAQQLTLSTRTVERHVSNIYTKIGVRTRAQATAYALTHGLGALAASST